MAPSYLSDLRQSPNYKWWVLVNVATGTFMATLDGSIVNVALPTISAGFHANLEVLQWVITAYLLTISSLLLIFGRLADILGRKQVYTTGFLVFVAGSLLCGLATSVGMLITTRIIQAVGAAMLMANGMGIVTTAFPPQERGRALGTVGLFVAAGSLTGPSVGGLMVSAFGWPSIFLVNIPVGILGFVMGQFILSNGPSAKQRETFDVPGALLFSIGIISLLLGFANGQKMGWTSPLIIATLVGAVLLLILFYINERRINSPMIDLNLFRNHVFFNGTMAALISFIAMFCANILIPFYLEGVLRFTPKHIGLAMTPFPLAMALVAPFSGWLSDKIGPIALTTGGMAINALGLVLLSFLGPSASFIQVSFYLALLGIGAGMFQSPNNSSIMGSVPQQKLGIAGGINALVRNVGMVLGVAFGVSLFTALGGTSHPGNPQEVAVFLKSMSVVFRFAAVIALVGLVFAAVRGQAAPAAVLAKRQTS
ncbi:MAG: MFS transporter [Bacillota bacterium]